MPRTNDPFLTFSARVPSGAVTTVQGTSGFTFTKGNDFGAVLVTQAPVQTNYYSDDTPFYRWLYDNFTTLEKGWPQLFESDIPLWVITKTQSTAKCSISCWSGSQQQISLQFGFKVSSELASFSPDALRNTVKTSGPGWAHYGVTELSAALTAARSVWTPANGRVIKQFRMRT